MSRKTKEPKFVSEQFEIGINYYDHADDCLYLAVGKDLLITFINSLFEEKTSQTLFRPVEEIEEAPLALLRLRWGLDMDAISIVVHEYLKPREKINTKKRQRNDAPSRDSSAEASVFEALRMYKVNLPRNASSEAIHDPFSNYFSEYDLGSSQRKDLQPAKQKRNVVSRKRDKQMACTKFQKTDKSRGRPKKDAICGDCGETSGRHTPKAKKKKAVAAPESVPAEPVVETVAETENTETIQQEASENSSDAKQVVRELLDSPPW